MPQGFSQGRNPVPQDGETGLAMRIRSSGSLTDQGEVPYSIERMELRLIE